MKVAIVGAGAMGCLFGVRLAEAGVPVTLVDKDPVEIAALIKRGIRIHDASGLRDVPVIATLDPAANSADLVLVFVKAHQTHSALETVTLLAGPNGRILTLQNGLGAAEVLAERVAPNRLFVGTTAQGATQLGPGEIRHGGAGETVLGPVEGPVAPAEAVAALFTKAGLSTRAVTDPWTPIWTKLAVNCAINPLTALTGILNGGITGRSAAEGLVRDVTAEVVAVARGSGIDLGPADEVTDRVLAIARATAANRSSMGQDVDRGAPTEIDFINGAVTLEGERLGVPTPVNRALTLLVKMLDPSHPPV